MRIINPEKYKLKLDSAEGRQRLNILDDLNFEIQKKQYYLSIYEDKYFVAKMELKEWLGIDLSVDERQKKEEVKQRLRELETDNETV